MGLCPASPLSGCRYRAGAGAVPAKASGRGQGKGLLLSRLMSSNSSDSDQGRGNEKTFAEENLDHAPEDLSANLKNVVDDLAAQAQAEREGEKGREINESLSAGSGTRDDGSSTRFRELIKRFAPPEKKIRGKAWVPLKPPEVDGLGRAYGLGRRKRSIARVWVSLSEGDGGVFFINKRPMIDYFPRNQHQEEVLKPLETLKKIGHFHVRCQARGGGTSGQAGAIRLGLARALENHEPWWRRSLKDAGLLTRDSRKVERKKPGLKKARKAPQWVKR